MKLRKILAILLSFLLLMMAVPVGVLPTLSVSAATKAGTTGECTGTLDNEQLTISGNGVMGNYSFMYSYGDSRTTAPWGWKITSVTIEDGVTTIGKYAFYACDSLTSVTIPDSVVTIMGNAFYGCDSLVSLTIPDSVTTIADYTFYGCNSLTAFAVADANPNYCSEDGVLFNKDMTRLIQCPGKKPVPTPSPITSPP